MDVTSPMKPINVLICRLFRHKLINSYTGEILQLSHLPPELNVPRSGVPETKGTKAPSLCHWSDACVYLQTDLTPVFTCRLIWRLCLPADWSDACGYLQTDLTPVFTCRLIWRLWLPAHWSDACVYLQRTKITVVVLDDLGWQVVEHVLLHASEDEGQDLAVKLLHGQGTCTANTATSLSHPHSGLTINSTDSFSQLTDPFIVSQTDPLSQLDWSTHG